MSKLLKLRMQRSHARVPIEVETFEVKAHESLVALAMFEANTRQSEAPWFSTTTTWKVVKTWRQIQI